MRDMESRRVSVMNDDELYWRFDRHSVAAYGGVLVL